MDLSLIVARLRARVPDARQVKFAISLAAAMNDAAAQQIGDQWLYVVPGNESPSDNAMATLVTHQSVRTEFGVVIIAKNVRDRRGDAAKDDLYAIRTPVRGALHGWVPPGCDEPITLRPSSMQGFNERVTVWRDGYATSYSLRTGDNQ